MLENPWVFLRSFESFALPKEPRGRGMHQCHVCLWLRWVTVSSCMGGYWEDQVVAVSLEDGRCAEVTGQMVVWKLGVFKKETVKITQCKGIKECAWLVCAAQYGQPVVWFPFAKRNARLRCGAPVCQHAEWRWFAAHPRGENISLMCGCRTDAVREEKQHGVVVEQLGRQLDAVEHPSSLHIPATFFSLCCFSSTSSGPPPAILKKGVGKDRMDFPFQSLLRKLMLHIHLCHCVFSKIKYKET